MKKILFLFLLTPVVLQAQYKISGTINATKEYKYALLYKIEGARQVYIKNTTIDRDTIVKGEKQHIVSTFEFDFTNDIAIGSYRIAYDFQNGGFVDILYDKEDVAFTITPGAPQPLIEYQKSKENMLYQDFLKAISLAQRKTDSIQIAYLKAPSKVTADAYKASIANIKNIQSLYYNKAKGSLVSHFIKATDRYNAPEVATSSDDYFKGVQGHFFDNIDFTNSFLYNSSFLIDRISDYVFYMNYSEDVEQQFTLHKNAADKVLSLIGDQKFKADIVEFLITQFSSINLTPIVDYMLLNHFDKLSKEFQNKEFKDKILKKLSVAVGRTAPDFSWEENGKTYTLSQLKEAKNYILIFYSTECPHCTREVPHLFKFMKDNGHIKVIAFAMETSEDQWNTFKKDLPGWHHALGLGKWDNMVARRYQIVATPSYFVLDANKKIIGNPIELRDLEKAISKLKM